jgi:hypothetical protein
MLGNDGTFSVISGSPERDQEIPALRGPRARSEGYSGVYSRKLTALETSWLVSAVALDANERICEIMLLMVLSMLTF